MFSFLSKLKEKCLSIGGKYPIQEQYSDSSEYFFQMRIRIDHSEHGGERQYIKSLLGLMLRGGRVVAGSVTPEEAIKFTPVQMQDCSYELYIDYDYYGERKSSLFKRCETLEECNQEIDAFWSSYKLIKSLRQRDLSRLRMRNGPIVF